LVWGIAYFMHFTPDIIWEMSIEDALFWFDGICVIRNHLNGKAV